MNDFAFTFDTAPFMKGIDKLSAGMSGLAQKVREVASRMSEVFKGAAAEGQKSGQKLRADTGMSGNTMAQGINMLTKRVIGLGAAYLVLKGILSQLPEIGRTFSIAGDIIRRNLFWPLRKELMPILQRVLDWTRDNRARFVQWGSTLVNIFRGVVSIAKSFIDVLKPVFSAVTDTIKRFVGNGVKSVSDFLNIVVFRLVTVMTFIAEALRPVFEKIGQWIRWAGEKAQEFVMGFSAGIDGLMPALGDLGGELQIIGTDIASLFRAISEDLMPSMMDFGDFLGTTLVAAVRVVTMVLGFLWATLKGIFKTVKSLIQVLTGDFSGAWETFSSISDDYARTFEMMGRQGTAIAEGYRRMDRRMVQRGAAAEMQRSGTGLAEWHPGEGGPRGRTGLRPVNNTINRSAQLSSTVRIDRMEVNARTPEEAAQVGRSIADISEREQRDRARRLYDQDLQGRDQVRRSTTTIRLGTITQ